MAVFGTFSVEFLDVKFECRNVSFTRSQWKCLFPAAEILTGLEHSVTVLLSFDN